ncbi:MAG TPA: EF-hand domain-containing protein [Oceanipulchritudo sp.]|nr:EF-hand domain-containing protein [Oceanipulchritudo sp.]
MKTIRTLSLGALALFATASLLSAAPNQDKAFADQDKDGNGVISVEELTDARVDWAQKQGKKKGLSEAEIEKNIANAKKSAAKSVKQNDKDKDGSLSKEEWLKMRAKQ